MRLKAGDTTERIFVWLLQLRVMTFKELRQLVEDRALILYIIYSFTLQIFLAAGEMSTELRNAPIVISDGDHSSASRELIYRFKSPYFSFAGELGDAREGLRLLDSGEATVLLDIPEGFNEKLNRGTQAAAVQLLVDTSKANIGYLASSYGIRMGAEFSGEWAQRNLIRSGFDMERLPRVELESRIWFNPDLDEAWFGTIAELMTMITVACILLPATAMVREKERGTMEQLLVAPLSPLQMMASKILAMILVTLTGTAVSLFGIMGPFFSVPLRGDLVLFFALTALYAFTNAGLGLVAATFARSSGQVGMIVLLMVMPIVMLSGTRTPVESMPQWLQYVIKLFPMHHFTEITYGALLRGGGLEVFGDSVLWMALLGSVLFAVGLWRFRRQFE
jgi:ABC-2 type transport system permease protein